MIDNHTLAPTRAQERIEIVDILRGFAVLGIFIVNMGLFGMPVYALATNLEVWSWWPHQVGEWFIRFFAEGKFYPLFSLLFGWGLATQMARAEARGVGFVSLYARRLLILLGFGLAHAFLLWEGDILIMYALLGFVLLLFRRRQPRTVLIWSVVFLTLPILINLGLVALVEWGRASMGAAAMDAEFARQMDIMRAQAEAAMAVYASGTYPQIVAQHIQDYIWVFIAGLAFFMPNVMAMFLLGLYVGKRGLLVDVQAHLPLFRRWRVWGLALGALGGLVYVGVSEVSSRAMPTWGSALITASHGLGGVAMMLGYVGMIILLAQNPTWYRRLDVLAPVGRMALSNYLFHSVMMNLIFYPFGLGLYEVAGPALNLPLVFLIYTFQVFASRWWLSHFRFGPVEWLWRSLTYLKPQPMRVQPGKGLEPADTRR